MSDRDLGKALLAQESPVNSIAMADRVASRDRRRMWLLGITCVFAWMLAVMLPWSTTLPVLAKVAEYQAQTSHDSVIPNTGEPVDSATLLRIVKQGTIATFIGSIASMFVAALSTVALVIFSRRATMRQINARLTEIAAELKASPR